MISRIIDNPIFSSSPSNINLFDFVFVYSNGIEWKVIPLSILLYYPIIYDTYYDRFSNNSSNNYQYIRSPISFIFCPHSFSSTVVFDKISLTDDVHNNSTVFKTSNDNKFLILSNHLFINNKPSSLRTINVKLFKLRTALSLFPDCKFLIHNINNDLKPIINKSYFTNDSFFNKISNINSSYHPKKICFGIKYLSSKTNNYKYSILVADDLVSFENYIDKHITSITHKAAFITPVFWAIWLSYFPDSKIIVI